MYYHNITKDDMLNGIGLRVVLWLSGCIHACLDCHNPITWDPSGGIPFDEGAKRELLKALGQDHIAGITFSGGDPLHPNNQREVGNLIFEISLLFPQKNIWLYTGYLWEHIQGFYPLKKVDVVVDGKFIKSEQNNALPWRGSSNQRVIDVKKSLAQKILVSYI